VGKKTTQGHSRRAAAASNVPAWAPYIDADRFWSKVKKTSRTACWLWQSYRDGYGYGRYHVAKRSISVHRIAYFLKHGKLDPTLFVCHTCDNPACCNPDHLWLGTNADNCRDMVSKSRSLYGERNPKAKLTPSQVRRVVQLHDHGYTHAVVAKQVGCSIETVSAIITGKQWRSITGRCRTLGMKHGEKHPRAILTIEVVHRIMQLSKSYGATEVARRLGFKIPTVYSVLSGQTWGAYHRNTP
jgi:hypothetical protein